MIRAARPDEGERLREIAVAAKAHWGYDLERVRSWVAQGDFTPVGLQAKEVYVAEHEGDVVGWAAAMWVGGVWWLDDLWIDPSSMRRGVGTRLFEHGAERGRAQGATVMEWEAEPNALRFYEKVGGRYVRDGERSRWGRINAIMGVEL